MIVLDTHTLIWWVTDDASLSKKAKHEVNRELDGGEIIISAISAWEISMLVTNQRFCFTRFISVSSLFLILSFAYTPCPNRCNAGTPSINAVCNMNSIEKHTKTQTKTGNCDNDERSNKNEEKILKL